MQSPVPDNAWHTQETDINASGGIRTHNPNMGAAADRALRQCGHWDRQTDDRTVKE